MKKTNFGIIAALFFSLIIEIVLIAAIGFSLSINMLVSVFAIAAVFTPLHMLFTQLDVKREWELQDKNHNRKLEVPSSFFTFLSFLTLIPALPCYSFVSEINSRLTITRILERRDKDCRSIDRIHKNRTWPSQMDIERYGYSKDAFEGNDIFRNLDAWKKYEIERIMEDRN